MTTMIDVSIPGDKSTSTRALLLSLLADGRCTVDNVPLSRTTDHVLAVLRQLGAEVDVVGTSVTVSPPPAIPSGQTIDCGGSATLARILMGLLAGANVDAVVDGSEMLRRRPMERVRKPLNDYFGREVLSLQDGKLPARLHAGPPPTTTTAIECMESAQVRSALCFAAMAAGLPFPVTGTTSKARRALEHLCSEIGISSADPHVPPFHAMTPNDPSAEAFPLALAVALGRGLVVDGPPYRGGFDRSGFHLAVVKMGASFGPGFRGAPAPGRLTDEFAPGYVPANTRLSPRSGPLTGIVLAADPVPEASLSAGRHVYTLGLWTLIDEIPILAALCALASTPSRLCGLAELRVKESDRVSRTAEMLQAFGAAVVEEGDDLVIEPSQLRAPTQAIRTDHDHRIAMTALTLGRILDVDVELDDEDCVDESWRGFALFIDETARRLRAS
ncbi:MAG: hypothetical protein Q8O67_32360 [Deltaproteobacteria bacterium]|nr:hypothetical protein [Deltaproteobacteria bacterium]